ncbi:acylphosphatase [Candidatus Desulfofervidus auxilii]|uniref:Acylphosphatase n=2 Tax=Desulfofervidus auxilii TaxID=1621989 RepID=A0A7U4QLR0_DESA2|nr:acylphosphatase [Candidatus Desulfofervidus auxilii]CAD7778896.1 MAG: Acylphosphatase [Candidatus Methanoperedenaceae archaeon GB37]CAD7779144.1 Acylphosphatase [Candidatus Methanoperedenaceae archaeon GB50]AMM41662.1 acylphosphatase [Candidatus Desulfofervidus auxilii]MDL1966558.1 acylphosphatase [Candidatus Desulfofervidus auxilii]CAD7780338.1 Acylphosphatase [Candidatus Methanoperedenaceae archaeon GB37]
MEKARAHVIIKGRVQGVFFRSSTQDEAIRLGLTGWVKNCPDGSVEAVFEGDKKVIEEIIKWCHKGPPWARVNEVKVSWEPYQGEFVRFSVVY